MKRVKLAPAKMKTRFAVSGERKPNVDKRDFEGGTVLVLTSMEEHTACMAPYHGTVADVNEDTV